MTIKFIVVGKTNKGYFVEAEKEYLKRLNRYIKIDYITIPELKKAKNLAPTEIKKKELELIQKQINSGDEVILLDEKGKEYTSVLFSEFIQKKMNSGVKTLAIIVGGAYGFDDDFKATNTKISLSKMTFSHQMIRTFLLEQLYRGFSILNNEPYHNE